LLPPIDTATINPLHTSDAAFSVKAFDSFAIKPLESLIDERFTGGEETSI
jgi:hypothetical protein